MQQRYLNVTSDDLWCVREKLAGKKKKSLGKTYKTNREADDKVYPASVEVCGDLGIITWKKEAEHSLTGISTSP